MQLRTICSAKSVLSTGDFAVFAWGSLEPRVILGAVDRLVRAREDRVGSRSDRREHPVSQPQREQPEATRSREGAGS